MSQVLKKAAAGNDAIALEACKPAMALALSLRRYASCA